MLLNMNTSLYVCVNVLCLVSLSLLFSQTTGQKITYQGNVGCAVIPPGPPTKLKAYPGREQVRLRWASPRNNACVDEYVVDVRHLSDNRHILFDWHHPVKTRKFSLDIEGLASGEEYEFTIRAVSHRFDRAGKASIVASPRRFCRKRRPGKVVNLRAHPGDGYVEVCWDGVDNDACVAEYKVRTRIHTDYYRRHYDHPEEISKGGCVVIGELQNNVKYEFSVMAYGKRNKKGIPTYVLATPKHYHYHKPAYIPDEDIDDAWEDDYSEPPHRHHDHKPAKDKWKCHSIANSYPDCEASKKKLCLPMSCKDQARVGNCDAPFMRHVDYDSNTITQFCGDYCPCIDHPPHGHGSRFLFLDDYCCRKTKLNYKIKDLIT